MDLEKLRGKVPDAILDDIETWRGSHPLARLRQTLETQKNAIPFWGEAMVARHIIHRTDKVPDYEVPTRRGRAADFRVCTDEGVLYIHVKFLRMDQASQNQGDLQSRLKPLRKISRPVLYAIVFYRDFSDAEMRDFYQFSKKLLEQGFEGEYSFNDGRGQTLAKCGVKPWPYTRKVRLVVTGACRFVEDVMRLRRTLRKAYGQFVPGQDNLILVSGTWSDDVAEFQEALCGSGPLLLPGPWDNVSVAQSIRDDEAFWAEGRHQESQAAGWFPFSAKRDLTRFRLWFRSDDYVPPIVGRLFGTRSGHAGDAG